MKKQAIVTTPLLPKDTSQSIFNLSKTILCSSAPFALTDFLNSFGNYLGFIILARKGEEFLAAESLISAAQTLLFGFLYGIPYAAGNLMKEMQESKNLNNIGFIFRKSLVACFLASIPVGFIMFYIKSILDLLQQPTQLTAITQQYFYGFALGFPANLSIAVLQQLALTLDKTSSMIVSMLGYVVLANSIAYVSINGKCGLPQSGALGLGVANTIACYLTLFAYLAYFKFKKEFQSLHLFAKRENNLTATETEQKQKEHKSLVKALFKDSMLVGVQLGLTMGSLLGLTALVGRFGQADLAAEQVALQYLYLFLIPFYAISQVTSNLVRGAIAADNFPLAKRIGYVSLLIGSALSLLNFVVIIAAKNSLISAFLKSSKSNKYTITLSGSLLLINGVGQMLDAGCNVCSGALRGVKDTMFAVMSGIFCNTVLGLPLAYTLSTFTPLQTKGVFIARDISLLLNKTLVFARFYKTTPAPKSSPNLFQAAPEHEDIPREPDSPTGRDLNEPYGAKLLRGSLAV